MIKLIASDMDGTLLNERMEISKENIAAIRAAQAQGIQFMVATGRGHSEALPSLQEAGIDCPMICLNGAQIYNEEGLLVYEDGIHKGRIKAIREILDTEDIYYEVITNQGVYSESRVRRIESTTSLLYELNPDTSYKMALILATARLEVMQIHYVDSFDTILEDPNQHVLKLLLHSSKGKEYLTTIQEKIATDDLVITSSFKNNLEVNSKNAQKGIALEAFAYHRGIAMSEVMALGDNFNDVSMLERAGISVAMRNAEPEVQAIADRIAPSNNESGVGRTITAYLNGHLDIK